MTSSASPERNRCRRAGGGLDAEPGSDDSHAREARWRYDRFLRSDPEAGGEASGTFESLPLQLPRED